MGLTDLASELKGGGKEPYRLGQITAVDFTSRPPTLTLGEGEFARPMRFIGSIGDYNTGQTVAWLDRPGAPIVLGPVPIMGADVDDPESLEPYHVVGGTGEPTFENGWTNFGTGHAVAAFYRQNDGWVRLKGLVASGSNEATIFTLPAGYRPPFDCYFTALSNGNPSQVTVTKAGTVTKNAAGSNNHVSLADITFPSHWNPAAWEVIPLLNNWSYNAFLADAVPEVFIRDDGWVFMKGTLATQAGPATVGAASWGRLPQDAVTRSGGLMFLGYETSGFNVGARHDVKIYGEIAYIPSAAHTTPVTGFHWFSARSDAVVTWTSPTLINGWALPAFTNLRPFFPAYYKDHFGVVHLRGLIDGATRTTSDMFVLPAGYRPLERHAFIVVGADNGDARIDVQSNGTVTWTTVGSAAGTLSLNGISFRAEQ